VPVLGPSLYRIEPMNILKRLFPQPKPTSNSPVTMALQVLRVDRPIPLSERKPDGWAWYGQWDKHRRLWHWGWQDEPYPEDTHWLPESVDVLPTRSFAPNQD
jgi:hypothetical protein